MTAIDICPSKRLMSDANSSTFDYKHRSIYFYIHFLHLSSKFSTSYSVNGAQIMSIIRIIAVINTMSTSQSISAALVKTSNGALLRNRLITRSLRN